MPDQHRVFKIVHSAENNRGIGKQFPVMGEQELKGMVIRGDNDIESTIPVFMPV
jgi:hypothetical protein